MRLSLSDGVGQIMTIKNNLWSSRQVSSLQRRMTELEAECRLRERELAAQLEEARGNEKKLQDNTRNLELRAEQARGELTELGLALSEAQGRISGLEAELTRLDGHKRELEFKLGSLHSALSRTLGIGGRGRGNSPALRGRSHSPRRSLSPPKGEWQDSRGHCMGRTDKCFQQLLLRDVYFSSSNLDYVAA